MWGAVVRQARGVPVGSSDTDCGLAETLPTTKPFAERVREIEREEGRERKRVRTREEGAER